jgi:hypothetical protein
MTSLPGHSQTLYPTSRRYPPFRDHIYDHRLCTSFSASLYLPLIRPGEYIHTGTLSCIQAALRWYRGFRASRKLNLATMRPLSFRRFRAFLMVLGEKETFPTISFNVLGLPSSRRENTALADDGSCSIFSSVFCVMIVIYSHLIFWFCSSFIRVLRSIDLDNSWIWLSLDPCIGSKT